MTPYFIPSFMLDLLIIHKGSPLILNSFFIDFHWFSLPQPRHPAARRARTPYAHTIITQFNHNWHLYLLIIYKGGPLIFSKINLKLSCTFETKSCTFETKSCTFETKVAHLKQKVAHLKHFLHIWNNFLHIWNNFCTFETTFAHLKQTTIWFSPPPTSF